MRLRLVSAASLALVAVSCSTRYRHQSLSPDAAALFARGEAALPGGSLVVDLEAMRELNFISISADDRSAQARSAMVDLLILSLTTAAANADDPSAAELLSRIAVLTAIMRDWGVWPHVQRLGIFVALPSGRMDAAAVADRALLVLAAKGDADATRELLNGLAAADRATGIAHLSTKEGFLCFENPKLPVALCLKSGSGYLALGTPTALNLKGIDGPHPSANPVNGPVARLRLEVPGIGKGHLLVEGHSSLRVAASVQSADPQLTARLLVKANELLKKMDDSREKTRALLARNLEPIKRALVADAEAPSGMKAAAIAMTVDRLLNSSGDYDQLRSSIKLAMTDGVLTAEMTVPETQVRRLAEVSSTPSAVAITGVLAAIAIPNFVYFDTRQPQKAIDAYQRALEIRPNNANVLTDQGVMYRELGQFNKAISNFQKANRIDPKHVGSLYNMGVVYRNDLNQTNKAIEAWKRVIQIAPHSEQAAQARTAIDEAKKAVSR